MAKRIGYIEKDGVIFVSVKDVFEYLREMEVITTDQLEWQYRWNFEQDIIKLSMAGIKCRCSLDNGWRVLLSLVAFRIYRLRESNKGFAK